MHTHAYIDPIKNYECGINDVQTDVCQTEIQSLTLIFIMILNKNIIAELKEYYQCPVY